MVASGGLVWCIRDGQWLPLRLDSIRLSGPLSADHWPAVSRLIEAIASQRIIFHDISPKTLENSKNINNNNFIISNSILNNNNDPPKQEVDDSPPTWSRLLEQRLGSEVLQRRLRRQRQAWRRNTRKLSDPTKPDLPEQSSSSSIFSHAYCHITSQK